MQSHLTRSVFRAILNNEPLGSSKCRGGLLHTVSTYRGRKLYLLNPHYSQRRGLFAFNPVRTVSEQSGILPSEVGLKPMRDLMRALSDKSRPPPNHVLAKAFRGFFAARVETPGVITGFHGRVLLNTWKHMKSQQEELESDEWQAMFSTENLEQVLFVLSEAECLPESSGPVVKLARYAFRELCADHGLGSNVVRRPVVVAFINFLCSNDNPEEALRVAEQFRSSLRGWEPSPWLAVMKAFAIKGDQRQIQQIVGGLEERGTKLDRASREELTKILIEQGSLQAVKIVYECPLADALEPSLATKEAVIRFAVRKSDIAWARSIFETLPTVPSPETRDVSLLWEAVCGKGASDIADTLAAWAAQNPEMKTTLSISTVNNLIEFANTVEKPQLAADFAALAPQWGLEADIRTHLLQLESRVQAGDVNGALDCLQQFDDINSVALENLPLMNKFITMLCVAGPKDTLFDQISFLLDPLFESDVRLKADTIAALTRLLLHRHDLDAVSELLRPRLGFYESEDRTKIRNALTDFILDPQQDTDHVWDAYGLLQIAFPETGVSMRTNIMTSFFRRQRSDLACMVFGHMRQAENRAQRPKPDTYARCFQGLSRTSDEKNLELVHNMLKLDLEVDLNTRILNGLMLAYASCDKPEKSMEIFRDILRSDEGPSQKTIAIFFKVCEKHHNGTQEAMKMMKKVKLVEIDMDRQLYTAYIEALAAQCEFDLATEAIDKMQTEVGCTPNRNTIGFFYNAIPYQYWKDQVEEWAKRKYPEQWAQLELLERTEHEEGQKFDSIVNEVYL